MFVVDIDVGVAFAAVVTIEDDVAFDARVYVTDVAGVVIGFRDDVNVRAVADNIVAADINVEVDIVLEINEGFIVAFVVEDEVNP